MKKINKKIIDGWIVLTFVWKIALRGILNIKLLRNKNLNGELKLSCYTTQREKMHYLFTNTILKK